VSTGAIYIVTQDPRYLDLLRISAASLRRAMPDLPITLFSQFPIDSPLFEKIVLVEPTSDGFYDKTRWIRESPYDRTMVIDADTYVIEGVPELFTLLDHFDCAANHEEYLNTDWLSHYPRTDVPASFPELNTGVLMLKRSERMDHVLAEWGRLYKAYLDEGAGRRINDQPFFRVALYYGEARFATLTREYNCKFRGQGYLNGPVKIIHGHVDFKLEPSFRDKIVAVINRSIRPRVYVAGEVYEQELVGRLADIRKANRVGRFPILPNSRLVAEAIQLKKKIKERGWRRTVLRD
jgi:hypothetical protein